MQCLSMPSILGDANVGKELSLTPGGWTEPPNSLAYQWTADGTPIPSATAATYTLVAMLAMQSAAE
jgi:hypothetical protein